MWVLRLMVFLVCLFGSMFDVEIVGVWRVGKGLYEEPVA